MRDAKLTTKTVFEEGLLLYYRHRFREAAQRFQDVLSLNPRDKVAQIYGERCQQLLRAIDHSEGKRKK